MLSWAVSDRVWTFFSLGTFAFFSFSSDSFPDGYDSRCPEVGLGSSVLGVQRSDEAVSGLSDFVFFFSSELGHW